MNKLRAFRAFLLGFCLMGASALPVAAQSQVVTDLTTTAGTITTDMNAIIPVALTIAVISIGVVMVLKLFNKIARRG